VESFAGYQQDEISWPSFCQACHRPGQLGGFSLLSFDHALKE